MKQKSDTVYEIQTEHNGHLEVQLGQSEIKIVAGSEEFFIPLAISAQDPVLLKIELDKSFEYFNSVSPESSSSSEEKHVMKGLLCANRECCRIISNKRSAYCSEACQIREQNLRQERVYVKNDLLKRKEYILERIQELEGDFNIDDISKEIQEIDRTKEYLM